MPSSRRARPSPRPSAPRLPRTHAAVAGRGAAVSAVGSRHLAARWVAPCSASSAAVTGAAPAGWEAVTWASSASGRCRQWRVWPAASPAVPPTLSGSTRPAPPLATLRCARAATGWAAAAAGCRARAAFLGTPRSHATTHRAARTARAARRGYARRAAPPRPHAAPPASALASAARRCMPAAAAAAAAGTSTRRRAGSCSSAGRTPSKTRAARSGVR